MRLRSIAAIALLVARPLCGDEVPGHVQIPVAIYNQLVETSRSPAARPRPLRPATHWARRA